jgi:hypothetical protein
MVSDPPQQLPLLPARHRQHDLFVCDVADAVLKDDMASMEHPVFSLSKNPETTVRRYENGNKWVEVSVALLNRANFARWPGPGRASWIAR